MPIIDARIVNVIRVELGGEVYFYSLEGTLLNTQKETKKETSKEFKTKGGVIKPPSPAELQHQQDKEKERELSLEERLRYEQSKAT